MIEFLRNFNSSCIEHLFIWFMQFDFTKRVEIIEFILNKPTFPYYDTASRNSHIGCKCNDLYEKLPPMRDQIQLSSIKTCIDHIRGVIDVKTLPILKEFVQHTENSSKSMVQKQVYKRARKAYSIILKHKERVFNWDNLSLIDAIIFMDRPLNFTVLEKTLPPTWRSYDRSAYDRFKLTPNLFLIFFEKVLKKHPSAYFFPTVKRCGNWKRDESALPNELENYTYDDVFIQPNLCGYHVIIHKFHDKIKFYNQFGIKLRLPLKLDLSVFKSSQFFGEFIILPVKDSVEDIARGKHLEFLHKRYEALATNFKFVLLDLYDFGGSNWSDCSYMHRRLVCEKFLEVNEQCELIPIIKNVREFEQRYAEEITMRTHPHFNGVIFRPKNEMWTREVFKFTFENPAVCYFSTINSKIHWNPSSLLNVQKVAMVPITTKFTMLIPFVKTKTESGTCRETSYKAGHKSGARAFGTYSEKRSCREILLLNFNGSYFTPFQKITPQDPSLYKANSHYRLIINGQLYSYGILKIRFNNLNTNGTLGEIISIESQYDKTLLDCVQFT